ncbi:MAG: oligosaccharide flippase family protein [Anaerolineae bacterium]|jgi:O-antigen/teichoic acid export membrane protein|nr:oligosaccharide flippase family protein [Anaerolineae bacterium]MBT4843765.1 oligosaccharide flippase family protein [Anaerolineae bacterium]MBT6061887.1 oligosaccharide flippase family protein [Anaerolineae bacterium]MBT6323514.1 oligosaccharide flippase family protein [Anaerolineae bacterium]MBT6813626.1 oligosaccharide flippase family protein [Anaerolineae bacterium]
MSPLSKILSIWQEDSLLRRVLKNSSYLFSSSTIGMGLAMIQSVLAARLLGVAAFGLLGMVMSFATSINRLLSFRIGELVIKYGGEYLAQNQKDRAAATLKAAALTEIGTSISAYALLYIFAPLAAQYIIKDPAATLFIRFYALALLSNFVTGTSAALLQLGDHFRSQAAIALAQNILTVSIIAYAYFSDGDIWLVLTAYLIGKVFFGLSLGFWGLRRANEMLGRGWLRSPFNLLPPKREFWSFAFSSNFSGTVNLVTRDSEVLWLGFLLPGEVGKLAAGYYKTALALINLILMPINPFIATTFPEISRAVGEKAWDKLKTLLKRLTTISAAWTFSVGIFLLIAGEWLITLFYGADYAPATPAALILLLGFGTANILYWNRPLLLSLGMPTYPLKVMVITGIAKIGLSFLLVPRFGYLAQAALMSTYFVVSVGIIVWKGMSEIRRRS